jgi:poly-gamma-glutamate capsule biosynthesis protein CapA/YwtB (metallophosphatase superfamily)
MHPNNIAALKAVRIDYASCANNHTLDFCEEGLLDTVRTLKKEGIAFAGVGESRDEATRPAVLQLPSNRRFKGEKIVEASDSSHEVRIYSASDHPQEWDSISSFHLINYSLSTRERLKQLLNQPNAPSPALKIFSVHWGPNYSWHPSPNIRSLAHFLVDECDVDIIHGHSSHHIQGVEVYKESLIMYGCGDFVDDYAVNEEYRNNMGAVWRVHVKEDGMKLKPKRLEVFPTVIGGFQVQRLDVSNKDHAWVCEKIRTLSSHYDTSFEKDLDAEGQMVLNV